MKLNRKISLTTGIFTTTMILAIGLIVYFQWVSTLKKQLEYSARDLAAVISEMESVQYNLTRPNGSIPIQRIAEELKLATRTQYIHILNNQGIYYAHTFPSFLGTKEGDPLIMKQLEEPRSRSILRDVDSSLFPSVEALVPIYYQGEPAGLVIAGMLNGRIYQDIRLNLESLILLMILAVFISLYSSGKLSRSIKKSMHGMEPSEIARLLGQRAMTLENLKEGIVTLDQEGTIIYFNDSARTLAGLETDDINGRIHTFFFRDGYFQCLESGKTLMSELIGPEGFPLQCRFEPILSEDRLLGVTLLLEDLTEVRARAEELTGIKQMNEGLRAQNHEFLNKLHTISGMIELEEYKEAVEFINGISHNRKEMTAKLSRLIKDPSVAGLLLGKYNKAQEKKIEFVLEEESFLSEGSGRTDVVNLVLGNLIENSLEELVAIGDGSLYIALREKKDGIVLIVKDTGRGIENADAVFRKGFSTKGPKRGLGLYLVKTSVDRSGGSVLIESESGSTRFTVILPLEKKAVSP